MNAYLDPRTLIVTTSIALAVGVVGVSVVDASDGAEETVDSGPEEPRDESLWTQEGIKKLERSRVGRHHEPSPLIFGDQSIPLRFSHAIHLEDLECTLMAPAQQTRNVGPQM